MKVSGRPFLSHGTSYGALLTQRYFGLTIGGYSNYALMRLEVYFAHETITTIYKNAEGGTFR